MRRPNTAGSHKRCRRCGNRRTAQSSRARRRRSSELRPRSWSHGAPVRSRARNALRHRAGKLAAVVASIVLTLTSGLAVAGALPESAQDVASVVLGRVGISIPTGGERSPTGQEQPTGQERPTGHKQPTVGVPPTTAAPPSTTSEVQPQPQPATNDADASAPAPLAPPADEPGRSRWRR